MSLQSDASTSVAFMGSGGTGVMTTGSLLLASAADAGWYGLMGRSFGPQIRGGEAAALLRLAGQPVAAPPDTYRLVIAFDWSNIERFAAEIPMDGQTLVLCDPAAGALPEEVAAYGPRTAELPLKELAKSTKGGRMNMIAAGLAAALIGLPRATLEARVRALMGPRGEQALHASLACVAEGWAIADRYADAFTFKAPAIDADADERWLISGNEAAGLGALRAGVRFVAAYPITPATDIVEWLAGELPRVEGQLAQGEDEIATINMCLGSSYGGVPSLTATSGPGLALMIETLGLAVASETPVVVIDVMRGGPSTGIPTKSEQADLNTALFGLTGDAPHLVVAPNGISDCIHATQWAAGLCEALQAAAIVLSDQALGQTRAICARPPTRTFDLERRQPDAAELEDYQRYRVTDDGVSPMSIPGTAGGHYTADGLEHGTRGTPSSQASDHQAQLDKRRRKLADFDYGDYWADIEGDGALAAITWGSVTDAVREALTRLRADGRHVRMVSVRLLAPVQPAAMAAALKGVEQALVVEQNHEAQFYHYLKGYYDIDIPLTSMARPGPLLMRPGEIQTALAGLFEQEVA